MLYFYLTAKEQFMNTWIETTIQVFSISILRYFLLAGIPFVLFYLLFPKKLDRFKIQERFASRKDFIREVWHSIQSTFVFTVIALMIWLTPLKAYTQVYDDASNTYPFWYLGVSVVFSLILHDTYFYWLHRLLHHKSMYRHTHLVHHQSTNPSPWTSYSFHIIEAIAEGLVLIVIVMVIPMSQLGVMLFTVSAFIINVYGHLGYEITPKWFRYTWMFELFNTSVHHNMHHSKFKGNYGLYFRIWDRLMKTEHPDYVKEYDALQAKRFLRSEGKTGAEEFARIKNEIG